MMHCTSSPMQMTGINSSHLTLTFLHRVTGCMSGELPTVVKQGKNRWLVPYLKSLEHKHRAQMAQSHSCQYKLCLPNFFRTGPKALKQYEQAQDYVHVFKKGEGTVFWITVFEVMSSSLQIFVLYNSLHNRYVFITPVESPSLPKLIWYEKTSDTRKSQIQVEHFYSLGTLVDQKKIMGN